MHFVSHFFRELTVTRVCVSNKQQTNSTPVTLTLQCINSQNHIFVHVLRLFLAEPYNQVRFFKSGIGISGLLKIFLL